MSRVGEREVMDAIEQPAASELPPVLHRSSRHLGWVVVVFVCLCTAGVYFLTDVRQYLESSAVRDAAPTRNMSPDDRAVLSEVISGEQKASDGIAELNRSITAQEADLKRISDQIAALTSRIDSLPNLVLTASRPSVPSPPSAQADPKPVRKLAPPSKPQGPTSVGGAPLVSPPGTDEPR